MLEGVLTVVSILIIGCNSQPAVDTVQYILYNDTYDNNFQLGGYLCVPNATLSGPGPYPAVIIIPDYSGISVYAINRCRMLAGQGYVSFTADIYGLEFHFLTNQSLMGSLSTYYKSVPYKYVGRQRSAVNLVQARSEVIPSKIALWGYCFGGTGVLDYAFSGNMVTGIVAFHPGLYPRLHANSSLDRVTNPILLYSGANDTGAAPAAEVEKLEYELNLVNATWELNRFSQINHAFTVWGGSAYNPRADRRSWEGALLFLRRIFGQSDDNPINPDAKFRRSREEFSEWFFGLEIVIPEVFFKERKRAAPFPAIIILPASTGVNVSYAELLASLKTPYVTFAVDYIPDFQREIEILRGNSTLYMELIDRVISVVKMYPFVDSTKVVVLGGEFGGNGALNYGITGKTLSGTISSFGELFPRFNLNRNVPFLTPVLIQSSARDYNSTVLSQLEVDLSKNISNVWEINRYGYGEGYSNFRSFRSIAFYLNEIFSGLLYNGTNQPSNITIPTK